MRNEIPVDHHPNSLEKDLITSKLLFELTLFSTLSFILAFLLIRFLLNLQLVVLLKYFSIHFQCSLFDTQFSTFDGSKWNFRRILFVFGSGYFAMTILGILLARFLKKAHNLNWKIRLFLTWLSFISSNTLPAAMVGGFLFFSRFGFAFQWLVKDLLTRGIISLAALILMVIFRQGWLTLFLRASPKRSFLQADHLRGIFVSNAFIKPLLAGFVILLLFNNHLIDGFWPLFLLSLVMVTIPFPGTNIPFKAINIRRSEKRIFNSPTQLYLLIFIVVLLWICGRFEVGI